MDNSLRTERKCKNSLIAILSVHFLHDLPESARRFMIVSSWGVRDRLSRMHDNSFEISPVV